MDPGAIAVRCLVAFVVLMALLRLRGKSAIAEATSFDFVLALIVGDLFDDMFWAEVPVSQFLVAAGALVVADTLASFLTMLFPRLDALLDGSPAILLSGGRRQRRAMGREQVSDQELDELLRLRGVDPARDGGSVTAILENDGELAVLREPEHEAATRDDVAGNRS